MKGMRKITAPTLIMASHSPKMAFVLANEENPVFVCSGFKRTQPNGFILLFELKPGILPDYFLYMCKYEPWIAISKEIDAEEQYGLLKGWKDVGYVFFDGNVEYVTTAEDIFLNGIRDTSVVPVVPSVPVQRQRIADAQFMEKMLQKKMAEKEHRFQQKEWLNEAHIRNCKHRLSNEIMPIRMAVERLQSFAKNNPDGIKLSDIVGKKTNQSVDNLLEGLLHSIAQIETEIDNITQTGDVNEQVLNVVQFLNSYLDKKALEYPAIFKTEKIGFDADDEFRIKLSPKALEELLDNIVSNAVRHGFTDKNRQDYLLQVSIESTDNDMCRITIANNGEPMSERARNTYFERGSFAGPTGNTGIGGNRVYDICDKAGGRALEPYSKEGFPVVISVEFPLV